MLKTRAMINLMFKSGSPLRIGSGEDSPATVLRVELGGSTKIYVPSSSIKGVLRRISEIIARSSLGSFTELERTVLAAHCEISSKEGGKGLGHYCYERAAELARDALLANKDRAKALVPEDDVDDLLKDLGRNPHEWGSETWEAVEPVLSSACPVCRLWGGKGLKGKILVRDVLLDHGPENSYYRSRVGIDRATNTRREKVLFTVEGSFQDSIASSLIADNIMPGGSDAKLLAATLEWLASTNLQIGGLKSVGWGQLELDGAASKVYYMDFKNTGDKLGALVSPEKYADELSLNEYVSLLRTGSRPD